MYLVYLSVKTSIIAALIVALSLLVAQLACEHSHAIASAIVLLLSIALSPTIAYSPSPIVSRRLEVCIQAPSDSVSVCKVLWHC